MNADWTLLELVCNILSFSASLLCGPEAKRNPFPRLRVIVIGEATLFMTFLTRDREHWLTTCVSKEFWPVQFAVESNIGKKHMGA